MSEHIWLQEDISETYLLAASGYLGMFLKCPPAAKYALTSHYLDRQYKKWLYWVMSTSSYLFYKPCGILKQKLFLYCGNRVGSCGHKWGRGRIMGHFCLSCVCLVYFLRKSTEFYVNQTECQRILFHLFLLIFSSFVQSLCFLPLQPTSVLAAERPRCFQ